MISEKVDVCDGCVYKSSLRDPAWVAVIALVETGFASISGNAATGEGHAKTPSSFSLSARPEVLDDET